MKKYILDTNIISYLEKDSIYRNKINEKLSKLNRDDRLYISILTLYELAYSLKGTQKEETKKSINMTMDFIKEYLEIITLDLKEVDIFASLKADYKINTGIDKNSIKKHNLDLLIASSAIAENAILVSNDKIFENLAKLNANLKYENWVK